MRIFGKSPCTNNYVVELTPAELQMVKDYFKNGGKKECGSGSREQEIDQFLSKVYARDCEGNPLSTSDDILDAYNRCKLSKSLMFTLMKRSIN